jgi:septum formation protein
MKPLSLRTIVDYVQKEKPLDKAGAYGIQGGAADFVEDYRGCRNNIIGLPLCAVYRMLRGQGLAWVNLSKPPAKCGGGDTILCI